MADAPTSRVKLWTDPGDDNDLAAIYARVVKSARIVPRMYQALANSPVLLKGWIDFAWSLRQDADSDRGLRELAILRVAQLTGSDYVWRSHCRPATQAGISQEKIEALDHWVDSGVYSTDERAVLQMTDELIRVAAVSDETWAAVASSASDREAVELVMTVSWYSCAARIASGLRIPLEEYHTRIPGLAAVRGNPASADVAGRPRRAAGHDPGSRTP